MGWGLEKRVTDRFLSFWTVTVAFDFSTDRQHGRSNGEHWREEPNSGFTKDGRSHHDRGKSVRRLMSSVGTLGSTLLCQRYKLTNWLHSTHIFLQALANASRRARRMQGQGKTIHLLVRAQECGIEWRFGLGRVTCRVLGCYCRGRWSVANGR
jgi:hypothetical protein